MPVAPEDALVENTFFNVGEWVPAGTPVVSLLPDFRVKLRFFVPEEEVAAGAPGRAGALHLRRLPGRPQRHDQLRLAARRVHAAGDLFSRDAATEAGLHGRGAARSRAGAVAAGARPAGRAWRPRRGRTMTLAIDVHGLNKSFGTRTVVDHVSLPIEQGRDLRLPRPQRLGQDHDAAHAVRPADARRRRRHLPRLRLRARARGDQAPDRLHDPALLALRGPDHRREPRLHRAASTASTAGASGSTPTLERLGLDRPPQPARRHAVGRLEAAAGAGRLRAARAQAAAARRADRRRRSQGAARLLGRDPPPAPPRA